jgi:S1-C subfamily serine protease
MESPGPGPVMTVLPTGDEQQPPPEPPRRRRLPWPGKKPSGQAPGSTPSGQAPGSTPSGQTPGSTPSGQAPGSTPSGQTPGNTPSGQTTGKMPSGRTIVIALVVIWAVVITIVVFTRGGGSTPAAVTARPTPSPSNSDAPLTVAQIYQTVRPSVVLIRAIGGSSNVDGKQETEVATGTGVIINSDGTILTADHVIAGSKNIQVTYVDGTTSPATVATGDAKQDIATLTPAKLPDTLVPAVLGGGVQVGDDVTAIGNPFGLTGTTTSGVVSGLDRTLAREKNGDIGGLIQFDAAVNPGNSGGPLINERGQVVGIVVALTNPTGEDTFIGIGFAVPIGSALGAGRGSGAPAPPL